MSRTADIANFLLSATTEGEAVKGLFAVAKVGRPTSWEPAQTMRAALPVAEAVAFAKRGVGFATMVASAPDPTGEVGDKLSKFPQKSVWRTLALNPDCSESTVTRLLAKKDKETTSNILENTDPRFWLTWLTENDEGYLYFMGDRSTTNLNDGPAFASNTMSRFLERWSEDEMSEFLDIASATPLLGIFVHSILRCTSQGKGPLTFSEAMHLIPEHLTAEERGWMVLAGLTDEVQIPQVAIEAISRGVGRSPSSSALPGPKATAEQLLNMLNSDKEVLHGLAAQSVVRHYGDHSPELVNTVLSHDNTVKLRLVSTVLDRTFRTFEPTWEGYGLLYPSTIDRLVQENDAIQSGIYMVRQWPTGDDLDVETRRVLLRRLRHNEAGTWLSGRTNAFRPDGALYIEVLREQAGRKVGLPEVDQYVRNHWASSILKSVADSCTYEDGGRPAAVSDEVIKIVDFLGSASLEYVATTRGVGSDADNAVKTAVIQILDEGELPPDSWSVVASLAPSWTGTLRELVKTASMLG